MLERVASGVNWEERTPDNVDAGWVSWTPGFSSNSVACRVRVDGEWITLRDSRTSTSRLAKIDKNHLDSKVLCEWAEAQDPELYELAAFFLLGKGEVQLNTEELPISVSHKLTREDIRVLRRAQVIEWAHSDYAINHFKVPKKDPKEARFISDCRLINQRVSRFNDMKMKIPHLHLVMNAGLNHKMVWSMDASAFFFQFKLKGPAERWFPLCFKDEDNRLEFYNIKRLPMGFTLAPILAQRASNLVMRRTQDKIDKLGICGKVSAWVDNYLIFANCERDAEKIASEMRLVLSEVNIQCKDVDKTGEFIGVQKLQEGLQLNNAYVEKAVNLIQRTLTAEEMPVKDMEILAGQLMWANYAIGRRPLARFPQTLRTLRLLPNATSPVHIHEESDQRKTGKKAPQRQTHSAKNSLDRRNNEKTRSRRGRINVHCRE